MCTLTFIPGLPGGGYLLAVNRDESPQRGVAAPPSIQQFGARQVIAPRDPDGGGTWVGVDDTGHCIAILNGDRPLPPGMLPTEEGGLISRGLLVHDLLEDPRFSSVRDELQRRHRLDALHFKPFKLVVVSPGPSHGDGRAAHILRGDWSGTYLAFEEESGPRCIVSSSYETQAVTNYRRAAFDSFVQQHERLIEQMRAGEAARDMIEQAGRASGGGSAEGAGGRAPDAGGAISSVAAAGGAAASGPAAGRLAPSVETLVGGLTGFQAGHHPEAPQGDARSVCMHRDEARTVSSTLVFVTPDTVGMHYRAGWPCQPGQVLTTTLTRSS